MKTLILSTMLALIAISTVKGQCVIYVCPETSIWGARFEDGIPPYATVDELKDEAYEECRNAGGTDCKYFFSSECRGCWWAYITGNDGYTFNSYAVWTYDSEKEAERLAREKYTEAGGVVPEHATVTTWFVPKY